MRKFLLSLLLAATAVTPALAQRTTAEERAAEREERQAKRAEAREERTQTREQVREERAQNRQQVREQDVTARERRGANVNERGRPTLGERQSTLQARQQQLQEVRDQRQESRQQYVDRANQVRQRLRPPVGARPDRPAPPPPTASNNVKAPQWHTSWRNDRRYDWHRYRDRNRSLFRLGFYFDPFGWGYRRYGIGWRLWPSYYSRDYWLDDPWMYRLPYAPWPYQWVRYYDDALLVNTYTGQVVDVMYDFFW